MFTSSGSTGGRGGDAKTIISPNTSGFGDVIIWESTCPNSKCTCLQVNRTSFTCCRCPVDRGTIPVYLE